MEPLPLILFNLPNQYKLSDKAMRILKDHRIHLRLLSFATKTDLKRLTEGLPKKEQINMKDIVNILAWQRSLREMDPDTISWLEGMIKNATYISQFT